MSGLLWKRGLVWVRTVDSQDSLTLFNLLWIYMQDDILKIYIKRRKEKAQTRGLKLKPWACHSSQSSFNVYRAFSVTASTGPLEVCWVRADTSRNKDWPTDSCQRNTHINTHTWHKHANTLLYWYSTSHWWIQQHLTQVSLHLSQIYRINTELTLCVLTLFSLSGSFSFLWVSFC